MTPKQKQAMQTAVTVLRMLDLNFESEKERVKHCVKLLTDALNEVQPEPVAMRHGFDGYGWLYIDSGSGSDWKTRHPDAEPLYTKDNL